MVVFMTRYGFITDQEEFLKEIVGLKYDLDTFLYGSISSEVNIPVRNFTSLKLAGEVDYYDIKKISIEAMCWLCANILYFNIQFERFKETHQNFDFDCFIRVRSFSNALSGLRSSIGILLGERSRNSEYVSNTPSLNAKRVSRVYKRIRKIIIWLEQMYECALYSSALEDQEQNQGLYDEKSVKSLLLDVLYEACNKKGVCLSNELLFVDDGSVYIFIVKFFDKALARFDSKISDTPQEDFIVHNKDVIVHNHVDRMI
jgi:hypothetical protein